MNDPKSGKGKAPSLKQMADFRAEIVDIIEKEGEELSTPLMGYTLVEVGANLLFTTEPKSGAAQNVIDKAIDTAKDEVKTYSHKDPTEEQQ